MRETRPRCGYAATTNTTTRTRPPNEPQSPRSPTRRRTTTQITHSAWHGGLRRPVRTCAITAGRRAFFLTLSITQRDPFRRDRRGATGLEVVLGEVPVDAASEQRGRGAKISADQARPMRHSVRAEMPATGSH